MRFSAEQNETNLICRPFLSRITTAILRCASMISVFRSGPSATTSTMPDLDHLAAGREDLLSWYHRWKTALLTDGSGSDRLLHSASNILVKINHAAVVKFGPPVTVSETANQHHTHNVLASTSPQLQVSVPRVYKYFEQDEAGGRTGCLVLEYICDSSVNMVAYQRSARSGRRRRAPRHDLGFRCACL